MRNRVILRKLDVLAFLTRFRWQFMLPGKIERFGPRLSKIIRHAEIEHHFGRCQWANF